MRQQQQYHIHFGAGKLGLGLVLPIIKQLQLPIALFQRPGSPIWAELHPGADVQIKVNSQLQMSVTYIADEFNGDLQQLLSEGRNLLVSTREVNILQCILSKAGSFSMAVGCDGFSEVLSGLLLLNSSYPSKPRLYAFENDFDAVKRFAHEVKKHQLEITVVPVLSDRICTSRTVHNSEINAICEEYEGTIVVFRSQDIHLYPFTTRRTFRRRLSTPSNVILTGSTEEEKFYYNRKLSLLNGVHYTMTIFAYNLLKKNRAPLDQWLNTPLVIWKSDPTNFELLQQLIRARIIRLIAQTDCNTLEVVFHSSDKKMIYHQLREYSDGVLDRISKTNDTTGRILNLNDVQRAKHKYLQHFGELNEFFQTTEAALSMLELGMGNQFVSLIEALASMKQMIHSITESWMQSRTN